MNRRQFSKTAVLGALGTGVLDCTGVNRFPFKKDDVIACFGDSITFAGKKGYVELLEVEAEKKRPGLNLKFLNFGLSSETVTGLTEIGHPGPRPYLFERLDAVLNSTKVNSAVFCYGINCGIYGKPSPELFTRFQVGVYSFLEKVKQRGITAILMTPPPLALQAAPLKFDPSTHFTWLNPNPDYDKQVLQEFRKIIMGMEHSALIAVVDIHSALTKAQAACYDTDPIHPNAKGHHLIADTFIEKLGF